jgi:primosomal protein N' (replication factor Y)
MNEILVNVAFNLPVDSLFTYSIPKELTPSVKAGCRVLAPLGNRKITGIIIELPETSELKNIKPVYKVLDEEPILNEEMLQFCKWISNYYFASIGEVIFSALPKTILMESKILYRITEMEINESYGLTHNQQEVYDLLERKPLTIKQLENQLSIHGARSIVHSLISKGLIESKFKEPKESKSKTEKYLIFPLHDEFKGYTDSMLDDFFISSNIKSAKQKALINYLIDNGISKIENSRLIKESESSSSVINSLVKKEILEAEYVHVERKVEAEFSDDAKIFELNSDQKDVIKKIITAINKNEFNPFLLYGVTGSGKTQVYIEVIKFLLTQNKTAIILVPEISLTPQLIHRFNTNFGDVIGVIHSRLSEGQKFDVFTRIISGETKIVIGARSALFAPMKNIGIIIVDEEHDSSYKQAEKNPRYNARDSAIIRAKLNNAVVVMGSATPSLESYYNARNGKYKLLQLPHRALKTKLPEVEIVDMREELKSASKFVKYETPEKRFLSSKLIHLINRTLNEKKTIILLQNRRGYSAYLECQDCGNVEMCINCDITLIYHKTKEHLRCHYCGYTKPLTDKCTKCGSSKVILKGTGTEKVEEELMRLFPKARIRRMDADTVRKKDSYRKILKSFHDGEFDILVGTQMISKGLDFPNVHLVGVISADIGLLTPDFRAYEKTFQLLMQVSGRSGRSTDFGKVIIQTMHPENYIFPLVVQHDYEDFYEKEIGFRQNFKYPPFSRLCLIEVESPDADRANSISANLYLRLKNHNKDEYIELLKPSPALIYKIKNKYRHHIIIKSLKSGTEQSKLKSLLRNLQKHIENVTLHTSERIIFDVDPVSFI